MKTDKPFAEYEFISVHQHERKRGRLTVDYDIISQRGALIGTIEFLSRWRQHVFIPVDQTVWSSGCLRNLVDAIDKIRASMKTQKGGG